MAVDWVKIRAKQAQIEKDLKKYDEQQAKRGFNTKATSREEVVASINNVMQKEAQAKAQAQAQIQPQVQAEAQPQPKQLVDNSSYLVPFRNDPRIAQAEAQKQASMIEKLRAETKSEIHAAQEKLKPTAKEIAVETAKILVTPFQSRTFKNLVASPIGEGFSNKQEVLRTPNGGQQLQKAFETPTETKAQTGLKAVGGVTRHFADLFTLSKGKEITETGVAVKETIQQSKGITGYVAKGATQLISGIAINKAYKKTEASQTLTFEEREYLKTKEYEEVFTKGLRASDSAIAGIKQNEEGTVTIPFTKRYASIRGMGNEISLLLGDKEAYNRGIAQELRQRGYSGRELEEKLKFYSKARGLEGRGEIAGLLGIETGGELIGEGLFSSAFKKRFGKQTEKTVTEFTAKKFGEKFIMGAKATAPAGFAEGFTGSITQQNIRKKPIDLREATIAGGLGAITAGTLGGAVIGTKGTKSKVLQGIGYLVDPYELAGDITAGAVRKTDIKLTKVITGVPTNAFIPTSTKTQTQSQTTINQQTKKPSKVSTFIKDFTFAINPSFANTPTTAPVKSNMPKSRIPTINPFSFVPIPTDTKTPIPADTKTPIPADTKTPIPADTKTPIDTETNIPTNVNANTPTNVNTSIPVITPIWRIPPPVPLGLPFGSGGSGGYGIKSKGRFVNELAYGTEVFRRGLGMQPRQVTIKTAKKSKKSGGESKINNMEDLNLRNFGLKSKSKGTKARGTKKGTSFSSLKKSLFG